MIDNNSTITQTPGLQVLNKLKINLNYLEQEQLAKAAPGAIEKLLHKVKLKVEKQHNVQEKSSESSEKIYYLEGISSDESPEGKKHANS